MVTICAVAGDEGADQMTEALINWPLMNKEMQEVRPLACRYIFWGGGVSLPGYHEFVLCPVRVFVVFSWSSFWFGVAWRSFGIQCVDLTL